MALPDTGGRQLVPPADAKRVKVERGELAYWELATRVYATQTTGFMTRAMSNLIMEHGEKLYARGGTVYGFHDWLQMSNYESHCRVELTNWVLSHRAQSVLHIAVASRIVAMGVAVANMMLGSLIHIHANEREIERALRDVLASGPG